MARNSTERLVAIWSRENPLFPVNRSYGQHINSTSIYKNVVLYCSHEGLFLRCCSCRTHLTVVFPCEHCFRTYKLDLRLLTRAQPSFRSECCSSTGGFHENSRSSHPQRAFGLERLLSLKTTRSLTTTEVRSELLRCYIQIVKTKSLPRETVEGLWYWTL